MSDNNVTGLTDEQLAIAKAMFDKEAKDKKEKEEQNNSLSNGVKITQSEIITVKEEIKFEEDSPETEAGNKINEGIVFKKPIEESPESDNTSYNDSVEDDSEIDMTDRIMGKQETKKEESVEETDKKEETKAETNVEKNEDKAKDTGNPNDFSDISDVIVEESPSILDRNYDDVIYNIVDLSKYKDDNFDFGIFGNKSKFETKKADVKNDNNMNTISKFMTNIKNRTHKGAIKRGSFIDYYLPMSNLVFRSYELSNEIVIAQLQTLLLPDLNSHKDEGDNISNEEFVNLVLKHTDVLCADGDTLTDYTIKNKISNADIEVMKLAIGVLMFIIRRDSEEERKGIYIDPVVKFDLLPCDKCSHKDSYQVDMRKSLISMYTENIIEHALKNFSFDKTFDELIASSIRAKGKGANYLDVETQTLYRATIADPSYDDMKSDYNKMYDYIINKYESYVSPDKRSEFYERNTLRDKYDELLSIIGSINNDLAESIEMDFNGLITYSYVKEIIIYDVPDEMMNGKITKEDLKILTEKHIIEPSYNSFDSTVEDFLSILALLPKKFSENIERAIVDCQKNQKISFNIKYKCTKCGHENTGLLDGTTLLGFRISNQQDS